MYDLVIRGGRVIDPSQNMNEILDVAVTGDKITAIQKEISNALTHIGPFVKLLYDEMVE